MDTLKSSVARYLEVTKKLNELNNTTAALRDDRRSIELDLAAAYSETGSEAFPTEIPLTASGMMFTVKRPGTHKKGWTLSKKQLKDYVLEILPEHGEDLFAEIVKRHEATLVVNDFSFDLKPTKASGSKD